VDRAAFDNMRVKFIALMLSDRLTDVAETFECDGTMRVVLAFAPPRASAKELAATQENNRLKKELEATHKEKAELEEKLKGVREVLDPSPKTVPAEKANSVEEDDD
jgi:hypothetical protein